MTKIKSFLYDRDIHE